MTEPKLTRPLASFDIESTGLNPRMDRIIDLGIVKRMPDGEVESLLFRVHPQQPIPAEASAIHGITDDDVKDAPPFKEIAETVAGVLEDCDLLGFNLIRYDVPLLEEEFKRAEVPFSTEGRRIVDAQRIFHQKEPRDLSAAVRFYAGEELVGAHGALADAKATLAVLDGQFARYDDLPADMDALHDFCDPRDPSWIDRTGRIRWSNGEAVINFGRNMGKSLRTLAMNESGFLNWIISNDFPDDTKTICRAALNGLFPQAPDE